MRFIKYLILAVILVIAVFLSVANREPVLVRLAPEGVTLPLSIPTSAEVPLYLVGFGGVLVGVLVGLFLELVRERRHRRAEAAYRREAGKLRDEVRRLTRKAGEEDDDIFGAAPGRG